MSDADPPRPLPRTRARLPFEPNLFQGASRRWALALHLVLAVGLSVLAIYMRQAGHAWTSGYVAAPAIGAIWFALRVFMSLAPKGGAR